MSETRRGECSTCGASVRMPDGITPHHNHVCYLKWSGGRAPWPFYWPSNAAKLLGVDAVALSGIASRAPSLRACKLVRASECGQRDARSRTVYNREDVDALCVQLGRDVR